MHIWLTAYTIFLFCQLANNNVPPKCERNRAYDHSLSVPRLGAFGSEGGSSRSRPSNDDKRALHVLGWENEYCHTHPVSKRRRNIASFQIRLT